MSRYSNKLREKQKMQLINQPIKQSTAKQYKVTIEFSLVEEVKKQSKDDLLKEISEAICNGEVLIPWVNKIRKTSLDYS